MSFDESGISVVIMTYDEAETLEKTVREITAELQSLQHKFEILIVDDGSTDGSGALGDRLAKEDPAVRVIHHTQNLGLGGVYRTGFSEAKLDFVTFFPADSQFPASIISRFLPLLKENDLVLGYLPNRKESFVKRFLSGGERLLYRLLFRTFPRFQGIFMIRRQLLQDMNLVSRGRGWAILMELILRVRDAGYRVLSVPTEIRPRQSGASKVSNLRTIWSNFRQMIGLFGSLHKDSKVPLVLMLAFVALFHFATLERYPPPFVDEGWFGSRAWAFRSTHQAFGPLDRGVFDRFPGYWTYFPWIPTFIQSLTYVGRDQPGLLPLRVLSVLFGLILLAALFFIAKRLAGAKSALLAVFLISFSRSFLYSAHLARHDIIVAALGFSAIALALSTTASRLWPHFVAGLAVGAAFEVHPYGCLYGPIPIVLYLVRDRGKALKGWPFWMFTLGLLTGIAVFVLLHIARYPQTWLSISKIAGSQTHRPPLLSWSIVVLYESLQGIVRLAFYLSPFLVPIAAAALIYLVFRRRLKERLLLTLLLSFALLPALILKNKFIYYAILFVPVVEVFTAYLFFRIKHVLFRVLLAMLMIGSVVYGLRSLANDQTRNYNLVNAELSRFIKPGESVMGNQLWWFALPDSSWHSWEELYYFRQWRKGATLEDAFLEFRPRILIVDAQLSFFIRQNASPDSYIGQLSLSATELNAILRKYARTRAEFDGGYYGKIQLIEFDWNLLPK